MSERDIIDFESARNEAIDAFFESRPAISLTKDNEFLVESGFRLAWERQQSRIADQDAEIERLRIYLRREKNLRAWQPIGTLKDGEVVLLYAEVWIDEDFNPDGIREGFRTEDENGPIISARWNDNQDCYETDSNYEATHWMPRFRFVQGA